MNRHNALWILAGAIVLFPFSEGFAEHHRPSISIADYRNAEIKLGKMIERGEVSEDRAEQRLKRMRLLIDDKSKSSANNPRTFTREEYRRSALKIREMVGTGEISKDKARKRLKRMRLMVDDKTKPSVNNRRTFTEDEYLQAEVRVRKMIENGEVSKVRAEQRLKLMRQRIR